MSGDSARLERVDFIVFHHTVTPPAFELADIDRLHAARGFFWRLGEQSGHVGYHRLYLPDGRVQQARPVELEGSHVGPHLIAGRHWPGLNGCSLGFAFVGDFTARGWYAEQVLSALDDTEAEMRDRRMAAEQLIGHREYEGAATACPGDAIQMDAVRIEMAHRLARVVVQVPAVMIEAGIR